MAQSPAKKHKKSEFPVDLSAYKKLAIDPWQTPTLSAALKADLQANIQLCRDAIVVFTVCALVLYHSQRTGDGI